MRQKHLDQNIKKNLGTYGDFSILSFNGNKTITTGGGGLIISRKKKEFIRN